MRRRQFLKSGIAAGSVLITNSLTGCEEQLPIDNFFGGNGGTSRTRRDAHRLGQNSDVIQAYRTAVARMRALPLQNCNSWRYQAAIHGTTIPRAQWPAGAPFNRCQHNNFNFLPWHRVYLYFFERIIASISGMSDFALPYWNYSSSGQANLPTAFRVRGDALFDETRSNAVNSGASLPSSATDTSLALARINFSGTAQFSQSLEQTPHNTVHALVGGNMNRFATSALDPIFWLHHCNIDRLWEVWLRQGGGRGNPMQNTTWLNSISTFPSEDCRLVSVRNSDLVNIAGNLGYTYDRQGVANAPELLGEVSFASITGQTRGKQKWIDVDLSELISESDTLIVEQSEAIDTPAVETISEAINEARAEPQDLQEQDLASEPLAKNVNLTRTNSSNQIIVPLAPASPTILSEPVLQSSANPSRPAERMRVIIEFRDIKIIQPFQGYFEIYLVTKGEDESSGKGRYAGNLNLFGEDPESRGVSSMQEPMLERSLDITDYFAKSDLNGDFSTDGRAVMLKPICLGKAVSAELQNSRPVIGEMELKAIYVPID